MITSSDASDKERLILAQKGRDTILNSQSSPDQKIKTEEPNNVLEEKRCVATLGSFSDFELISNYLDCLFTAIYSQSHLKEGIHSKLNHPVGPSNLQKIRLLSSRLQLEATQASQIGVTDQEEENQGFFYQPVLPISLYIQMEEILKLSVYQEEGLDAKSVENRHILHKMIYDSLNELLDDKRVYGIGGMGFQFKRSFKHQPLITQEVIFGPNHSELNDFSTRIVEFARSGVLFEIREKVEKFSKVRAGVLKEKVEREGWEEMGVRGVDVIDVIREEVIKSIALEYVGQFYARVNIIG